MPARFSLNRFFLFPLLLVLSAFLQSAEVFMQEGLPPYSDRKIAALPDFQKLAREIGPSVVSISVEADSSLESEGASELESQFLGIPEEGLDKSFGSGVVVGDQGYIVTNYHVIERAKRIKVRLHGHDQQFDAKLIGTDDKTDLALIKIKPEKKLTPVYLGNSDSVEVGQWVLAIGNQFELGQSATAGIVSGKSRHLSEGAATTFEEFIQTDASINPGSSGGPLINTFGQVVGINSAIFSPGRPPFGGMGFNIGIGFAIPINICKQVIREIKERGRVTRGLLGVIIQHLTPDLSAALGVKDTKGALVTEVLKDTPASLAGFKTKDVIIKFDGQAINDHNDLPKLVAKTKVGQKVEVQVLRNGKIKKLHPEIIELGAARILEEQEAGYDSSIEVNKLGVTLQSLAGDVARALSVESGHGLLVLEVKPDSPADRAGITSGDIILEVDNHQLLDAQDLINLVEEIEVDAPVLVLLRKKEGIRFLTLKLE
jgi:serine protease Do